MTKIFYNAPMLKEYRTLMPYYKKYRFQYLFGLLCLVITNAGQLMIPQYIRLSLNLMTEDKATAESILKLVLALASVAFVIALGRFFWRFFINGASQKIEKNLRGQIFYHLLEMSSSFFGRHKTGDIMARMTNDMRAIRMASGMALVAFVDGLFMTLAILWILFSRYPRLAMITIIPLPVITVMVLFAGSLLGEKFKEVQERFSNLTSTVQESMSGIRVIKTFNREDYALGNFEEDNKRYIQANISLVKIWGMMMPVAGFLTGLTACLLLFFGGRMVIWGELNPGDFVAVMAYLGMLAWPMMGAGFTVNLIQRGAASLKRINSILDEPAEIANQPDPTQVGPFQSLSIKNLDFHYSNESIINDLTLYIKAGESLGILGRTGSGKSTLINLLPRILESPRGCILYNGLEIHDLELSALRKTISLIPQETFLFSASIIENIRLGKKDAPLDKIQEVVELTTLDRDLKNFPKGLETQVGEKGISLSGGQKQRIALARALIADPQVLILDDALSAVDTKTEEFILSRFFKKRKGLTNILISHRVSTLMNADSIIVLDKGRIIQKGHHDDLILQDGLYQKIYKLQSLDKS
ncbi:ABC transporter ATP-binding protein [Oceanispirochaeta sp.]|jgi:ATP-binding cassette subfamily B multidrug efflux pump|uniref:ABC transporter ATP-binding protein n=1 Tax=Oceanispirochaeta sp. TaxID=2035350 RepID=UPI0026145C8F|nr:ABC transporter ATP-binding protein [Oceanispirochaeta sp.]MDA3958125.1 ABC transporter ATP-binding protein [Oceanispirochaeta sp.]